VRIVTLVPAATEIASEIGLGDELVGVSADSDWPPAVRSLPDVTHPRGSGGGRGIREADRLVAITHGIAAGQEVDLEALLALAPDLVVTQERCRVCRVEVRPVPALPVGVVGPPVVSLEAASIEGIFNAITTVGAMTEAEDDALDLVESLRARLGVVEERVERRRDDGHRARRVVALQRLLPPATCGHWIPEQIRRAGGWEVLGEDAAPSRATMWDVIREVDPEVLLFMPADQRIAMTRARWQRSTRPAAWSDLTAVEHGQVFLLDGPTGFARPGPRVIDGIEILAEVLDPDGFVETSPPGGWAPLDPL
jgi:iron complex transport system substrate-binding protein